jgi:hypothetical protein
VRAGCALISLAESGESQERQGDDDQGEASAHESILDSGRFGVKRGRIRLRPTAAGGMMSAAAGEASAWLQK